MATYQITTTVDQEAQILRWCQINLLDPVKYVTDSLNNEVSNIVNSCMTRMSGVVATKYTGSKDSVKNQVDQLLNIKP